MTRGLEDANPVIFQADMSINSCKWNVDGTIVCLSGGASNRSRQSNRPNSTMGNIIKFYSPYGEYLRCSRIPADEIRGRSVTCFAFLHLTECVLYLIPVYIGLSWEGSGLRIALAVDACIYFANIRPSYTWAYLLDTVVFCKHRPDRGDSLVVFWDLTTNEVLTKSVANIKFILSAGDCCAFIIADLSVKGSFTVVLALQYF